MTTRDELRDQIERTLLSEHSSYGADSITEMHSVMPLVDAYVAEKLAEQREIRSVLLELVDLKDGPRGEDYEQRKPQAWGRARVIVRDFGDTP